MAALTAAHPASNEADSQFPAAQAVRLGKLLFGGLEDCLRRSPRVYLVSSPDTVEQVPPAALLAEIPPALGNGYDLRAARWLVRDHAFVRTSSINAFVATKRLSRTRSATLDYLGVGDPVLAPGNPGAMALRGGVNSLQELPETADEVQRVAGLFDKSKARLLRRQSATEEDFRLQPLSEFDVIHFATHGLIREELPGLAEPSLVFTPASRRRHPERWAADGFADRHAALEGAPRRAVGLQLRALRAVHHRQRHPGPVDILRHRRRAVDDRGTLAGRKRTGPRPDHRHLPHGPRRQCRDRRCHGNGGAPAPRRSDAQATAASTLLGGSGRAGRRIDRPQRIRPGGQTRAWTFCQRRFGRARGDRLGGIPGHGFRFIRASVIGRERGSNG